MALLYDPRFRALDSSATPVSGALLRIYAANTTTLANVYADEALSTPLTNPVVADSAGWFAQVFVAPNTRYDIRIENPDATLIKEFTDVDSLGVEDASVFLKDFSGDGRAQITGVGGVISLEFMPPLGDDIGGAGRIGGAEQTQAESLELDAAQVTVTGALDVDGTLTMEPTQVVFPQFLTRGDFSSASSVTIALSSSFDLYTIYIAPMRKAGSNGDFTLQLSFDGGSTFKSGASDYIYQDLNNVTLDSLTTASSIALFGTVGTQAGGHIQSRIELFSNASYEASGEIQTAVFGNTVVGAGLAAASQKRRLSFITNGSAAFGKATHLKITVSAGNISGKYAVYGIRT